MLPELSQNAKLYSLLLLIERDLVAQTIQAGCPHCGGPLHHSDYIRKPRGGPDDLPEELMVRNSLCCGREGCRKRTLPPSVLFMGRRVYWANVILVVVTLRQDKPQEYSKAALMDKFGMCRKTINKWIEWFRDIFPHTGQWQRIRGLVSVSVSDDELPSSLMHYFHGIEKSWQQAVISCLKFLSKGDNHAI